MKNIALVNPRFPNLFEEDSSSTSEPVSLISLASVLENNGYKVKIYNGIIDKEYIRKIFDELDDIDLLGITAMTCQIKEGLKISKAVKAKKNISIVWGGCHATLFPKQTCTNNFIDFVIQGEGEETLLELLKVKDLKKIKGLVYKKNNQIILNPSRGKLDMEKLPFPSYNLLDMNIYGNFKSEITGKRYRRATFQTSRGCPHRCSFCINYITGESKYRFKSVKKTISEIKRLIKEYNVNYLKIRDENFFANIQRSKDICKEIIKENLNLTLEVSCRANYFGKGMLDDEALALATKAGIKILNLGIESGSQRILDYIKKDITLQDAINSAKQCNKYNIIPVYSFMCGLPTETKSEMKDTIKLIKSLKQLCSSAYFIGPQPFRPYPGGELYENAMAYANIKAPNSLEEWDKKEFTKLYDSRETFLPWNNHLTYAKYMANYTDLALSYRNKISNLTKNISIKNLGKIPFVLIAKLRWKLNLFDFPVEQMIFGYFQRMMIRSRNS